MALLSLTKNVNGTPLPKRESTFNPFTYRGPEGPESAEARELVARYQALKAELTVARAALARGGEK